MHPRKIAMVILIMISTAFVLTAQTVTITIVQNKNAPDTALGMSRVVEDALLGVYYDSGMIVTTTEIAFDGNNYRDKNYGVKAAAHGMSDYVLVVYMQYGQAEKTNTELGLKYAELKKATWKLVHVRDIIIIEEQKLDLSAVPIKEFDPYKQISMLGELIARDSLQAMRDTVKGEKN
ncbi:MAG TPA: hypothetical protein PLV73_06615 [Treponemataceae bacterium]|nr:hypothetical protein [Treponemataceae bacterium]